jgi:alkylhydroperoxidase family enzyme
MRNQGYLGPSGEDIVAERNLMSGGYQPHHGQSIAGVRALPLDFAVSLANGCRYRTLHQVLRLRRLGVSMNKLMQMKKDDEALTPQERVAVLFARKVARDPASMTDADYE